MKFLQRNSSISIVGQEFPGIVDESGSHWYLIGYAILAAFSLIFVMSRLNLFAWTSGKAARVLHDTMLDSVLQAPMYFFETTPMGRLTNRFSYDTEIIDANLFQRVNGVVASTSWLLFGGLFAIAATNIAMIPVMLLVLFLYWRLYTRYRRCCVDLQRLDAITRSPIQTTFIQVINGLDSLRAYNLAATFLQ